MKHNFDLTVRYFVRFPHSRVTSLSPPSFFFLFFKHEIGGLCPPPPSAPLQKKSTHTHTPPLLITDSPLLAVNQCSVIISVCSPSASAAFNPHRCSLNARQSDVVEPLQAWLQDGPLRSAAAAAPVPPPFVESDVDAALNEMRVWLRVCPAFLSVTFVFLFLFLLFFFFVSLPAGK